jgi:guanine deaminase
MKLVRGRIYSPTGDPFAGGDDHSIAYEDGWLAIDGSKIAGVGRWSGLPERFRDAELLELGEGRLVTPGFVDTHLHAPQLEMIGSYGGHLLEWLEKYTFPTEAKFADPRHAAKVAAALFDQLIRNGTVAALIFSSVHTEATRIFFEEAERRGHRSVIGKTMMDRNAPAALLENPADAYAGSRELIEEWHGRGRLRYAITPRFAPTSTHELLSAAGRLREEYPTAHVQTHVSENVAEVAWVRELFPDAATYVDVYDRYGLLGERTVLAHGVHLSDGELDTLAERGSMIAHCPNSNLFLGSGLFPLKRVVARGITVGLGSDIGAGTSLSIIGAMADAYKVQQVRGVSLSPFHLWYLATLGGARALSLDDVTGSLVEGKEADFLVLDLNASPLLSMRIAGAESISEILAGLIFVGDDRVVERVYIGGEQVA